jgi:AcrR family transcriptional regulator
MVKGRNSQHKATTQKRATSNVSRPPIGRRERRATQTRVKLFRCALRLIAQRGLSNVTVEDITDAADVGKGTFFNYFESKEHVLGVMAEIQLGKVREAAALAGPANRKIRSVLNRMILSLTEEPGRNPRTARALISSFHANRDVRATILGGMREARKTIAGLVAIGQQRGEIDRKLNKDQVALHLFQSFLGTLLLWSIEERPALRTSAAKSFEHFWRSIAPVSKRKKL